MKNIFTLLFLLIAFNSYSQFTIGTYPPITPPLKDFMKIAVWDTTHLYGASSHTYRVNLDSLAAYIQRGCPTVYGYGLTVTGACPYFVVVDTLTTDTLYWKTNGNAGTTNYNFLGTRDYKNLFLRVNNTPAGMLDIINGNAMYGTNTSPPTITGTFNDAFGNQALNQLSTGNYNTAVGNGALTILTDGNKNTVVGHLALQNNNGSNNTAIGDESGVEDLTGKYNIYIGDSAGCLPASVIENSIALGTNARADSSKVLAVSDSIFRLRLKLNPSSTGYVLTKIDSFNCKWLPASAGGSGIDSSICNPKAKVDTLNSCNNDDLVLQHGSAVLNNIDSTYFVGLKKGIVPIFSNGLHMDFRKPSGTMALSMYGYGLKYFNSTHDVSIGDIGGTGNETIFSVSDNEKANVARCDSFVYETIDATHSLTTKWVASENLLRLWSPSGDTIAIGNTIKESPDGSTILPHLAGGGTRTIGVNNKGKIIPITTAVTAPLTATWVGFGSGSNTLMGSTNMTYTLCCGGSIPAFTVLNSSNEGQIYTRQFNIKNSSGDNYPLTYAGTGSVSGAQFNRAMAFPTTDGSAGQFMTTNGSGTLSWSNGSTTSGTVTSIATTSPITGGTITSTGTIGITQATTSTNGYLSSTDWNTFNGKSTVTPAALTKTDDTNVTLTLGGTPASALLQATSITAGWTGLLSVPRGGTGAGTFTAYSVITGGTSSTSPLQSVSGVGTSGQVLTSNGAAALPTWQTGPGSVTPFAEVPSGTINSSNVTFTLANTPASNQGVIVVLDGVTQYNGLDYTVSGTTITFTNAPATSSTIFAYYNTSTSSNTITYFQPSYVAVSSTYSILNSDYTVNCTSGTFTATLPTAVGITGRIFCIANAGIGVITLATTGGQTINGLSTQTIAAGNAITVVSTGSNFRMQ